MRLQGMLEAALAAQRGALFPWVPVCLAVGIGGYFMAGSEPEWPVFMGLAIVVLVAAGAAWQFAQPAPLFWAMSLIAAGFCLAGWRAHDIAAPVMGWRYYGAIEGRVVGIDRSASDALRLTLDQVVLDNVAPHRTPARLRLSLHGDQHLTPAPGDVIMATGHLSPPGGPVEPGGFDFQRHAWFQGLGAVGYTRTPAMLLEPNQGGQWLFRARMALSARVQAALSGETGGFAAAVMTGDRSGIGQGTMQALRVSNLAHLLAISGLHMGLLAGFVFAAFRIALALVPAVSMRIPAKKIAAAAALAVAAGYLGLSGGNVATQRAFVMVAVVLLAVMLDRRALSLRAVAVAAMIVLVLRPEALMGPGFQMSFAATTALVAVFGLIRDREWRLGPKWLAPFVTVVISSAVAGLATGPIGAAHFNQMAHYGLPANLLSVPLMGLLVVPAAVIAVLLLPLGSEGLALKVMGLGLDWILGVAHHVAAMEGARGAVVSPPAIVLPLMALGFLFMVLWQGRVRMAGILPVCAAFWLWSAAERPMALIAEDGGLVGVMTGQGRALSKPKGAGFVASIWLENDGDMAEQKIAASRWPRQVQLAGLNISHVRGKRAAAGLMCGKGDLVVLNVPAPKGLTCVTYDPQTLRRTGSIALYDRGKGLEVVAARDLAGERLWNSPDLRQRLFTPSHQGRKGQNRGQ